MTQEKIISFKIRYKMTTQIIPTGYSLAITQQRVLTSIREYTLADYDRNTKELQEIYLASSDVRKSSRGTYRRTLKQFFKWINEKGYKLSQIGEINAIEYKEELIERGLSKHTVSSYLQTLKKFYSWCSRKLKNCQDITADLKLPEKKNKFERRALSISQSKDLVYTVERLSKRDEAIVNLLLRAGLRTIEVSRAKIEDIEQRGKNKILYVHGKGKTDKTDYVVLTKKTYELIEAYLDTRSGYKKGEPLFTSTSNNSTGRPLSTRTISKIAKEAIKGIGLNDRRFTAHSLRHTAGCNLGRAGATKEEIQEVLRHASGDTTELYLKMLREEERLENPPELLIDTLF